MHKQEREQKTVLLHMLLAKKYLAKGDFNKVKARLAADGSDQEAEVYLNNSLPTVTIQSVIMVLGMVMTKTWQADMKINIGEELYLKSSEIVADGF
jgi:hypothetical protein